MKFCPHCGKELSVQFLFCPYCGKELSVKPSFHVREKLDLSNLSMEFWITSIGAILLALFSLSNWVEISHTGIKFNLFSLWMKLSDIRDFGVQSKEVMVIQMLTAVLLILLLSSFGLLAMSIIKCVRNEPRHKLALLGFGITGLISFIVISFVSLFTKNFLEEFHFVIFRLTNSPYLIILISVFEIIWLISSKRHIAHTLIADNAFYGRSRLTNVSMANSVTSIGDKAFFECKGLKGIVIPNKVTSIGSSAFYGCIGLKSILLPSSITTLGESAFCGCTSLEYITIPSNLTSISDKTFLECKGLTNVVIPSSVKSIGDSAFCGCTSLTNITIPNSVTSIGDSIFSHCTRLASIIVPDGVTSIGDGSFSHCTSLEYVTIPNSVTSIGKNAFSGCTGLTSITIPDSVTSIGENAFWDCKNLTKVSYKGKVYSVSQAHSLHSWLYNLPEEFYNAVNES